MKRKLKDFSEKHNHFFLVLDTLLSVLLLAGTVYYVIQIYKFGSSTPVFVPTIFFGLCVFLFCKSKERRIYEDDDALLAEAPLLATPDDDKNTRKK